MRLSEQQLQFFDTFGFLGFPGLFADDVEAIIEGFEQIWAEHGGGHDGKPHDHQRRSAMIRFIDQSEYLCRLVDDPRIMGIAASLMGDDYNYFGSDGNYYVGDTDWHSDGWRNKGYVSIKMAFYLDPVARDTGCLRVIPGSHRIDDKYAEALQAQVPKSEEILGIHGRDVPAMPLETEPGDLILFAHGTKHASFGGSTRRRMFTMNFTQRYREEDFDELRQMIAGESRFWVDRIYDERMVNTAGPERMRHLEQLLANDGHLAELSRKRRAEMTERARG